MRRILNFIAWGGFVLLCFKMLTDEFFIEKHLLSFRAPIVGGKFRIAPDCEQKAEALLIAIDALPYLYETGDFGLTKAVKTIDADDYCTITKQKKFLVRF